MFERRLKLLLVVLAVPTAAFVLRLVQLQVACAHDYADRARAMLLRRPRFLPCLRGDITDREGTKLACDAPSWNICIDYRFLAGDPKYLQGLATEGGQQVLDRDIDRSWEIIADITGDPVEELKRRGAARVRQVKQIRKGVVTRRPSVTSVAEERMAHAVAERLDQDQQVRARMELAPYEWVEVQPTHIRRYAGGEAVGHLLGLLQEVGSDLIDNDLNVEHELARYKLGDLYGFRGVEALGERWLRGRRGRIHEDLEGRPISPPVKRQDGKTVRLTIDLSLQQTLYQQLAAAVERYPFSPGGAAVVLDVPSREVLALVSYPSLDPNTPETQRWLLAEEQPLRRPDCFRAVASCYPPGSTVKPMVLAAALADGKLGPDEEIVCQGRLFPDVPDKWRCVRTWGHGPVDPVYSIQHSCNVFYYHVGERMRVERLAHWMSQFGFGRLTGTGLLEERPGNLPVRGGRGNSRHMAIGQWRLEVTPIQAANMTATIASGVYRPVTIRAHDRRPRPATRLPIAEEYWRIVRRGMYQAVNEFGGTAFEHGRLTDAGDHVLLGKTGSATAPPQEWLYTCRFPDGRIEVLRAPDLPTLKARYPADQELEVTGKEPAAKYPTHGWFVGYLTSRQHYEEPVSGGDLSVAVAVVIEYAGHGGEVAAPAACDMMRSVLRWHRDHQLEVAGGDMQ